MSIFVAALTWLSTQAWALGLRRTRPAETGASMTPRLLPTTATR
jgi:hypothetical protein